MKKKLLKILTNYWEYSTDFERDHKSLGLINVFRDVEDEVDDFFIAASALNNYKIIT